MGNVFRTDEQRKRWNKYNSKYSKENYVVVCLKISKANDLKLINYLDSQEEGHSKFIKRILREKMEEDIKKGNFI